MANNYWNHVTKLISGELARADDVNTRFDGVATGFDSVEGEFVKSIRITGSGLISANITDSAAVRATKVVAFDGTGENVVLIADPSTEAEEWANKTDATVDGLEYSAKVYAQDVTLGGGATGGSAKQWAMEAEDVVVAGGEYSAKHYATKAAASAAQINLPAISGQAQKLLKVNAGETGYEFISQGSGGGLDADRLDGQEGSYYLPVASYTAADVLAKLLTVDGAGTGVDADLLDGQQGAYYDPSKAIPAGSVMLFHSTNAPTGWTKSVTYNDRALRIVNGTVTAGGTVAFSTAFANRSISGSVDGHQLTISEMPSHTHTIDVAENESGNGFAASGSASIYSDGGSTNATGGGTPGSGPGDAHTHGLSSATVDMTVQYVDVIIASKDAY